IITFMIQNHADRPLANLGCKLVRRLAHRRPFLSGVRASGNPGAVHFCAHERFGNNAICPGGGRRHCARQKVLAEMAQCSAEWWRELP
ncbi:hypothetical protein, partial [Sphingobium salicis]|uniref:hypothetical protein n=1 Tax=Sphingobium sp. 11R-BB TaxID=3111639 RepID=UPI003C1569E6